TPSPVPPGAGTGASHSPPKGTRTSSRYSSGARRQSARTARSTSSSSRSGTGSGRTGVGVVVSERAWVEESMVTFMIVPLVSGKPPVSFYSWAGRGPVTCPRFCVHGHGNSESPLLFRLRHIPGRPLGEDLPIQGAQPFAQRPHALRLLAGAILGLAKVIAQVVQLERRQA